MKTGNLNLRATHLVDQVRERIRHRTIACRTKKAYLPPLDQVFHQLARTR